MSLKKIKERNPKPTNLQFTLSLFSATAKIDGYPKVQQKTHEQISQTICGCYYLLYQIGTGARGCTVKGKFCSSCLL